MYWSLGKHWFTEWYRSSKCWIFQKSFFHSKPQILSLAANIFNISPWIDRLTSFILEKMSSKTHICISLVCLSIRRNGVREKKQLVRLATQTMAQVLLLETTMVLRQPAECFRSVKILKRGILRGRNVIRVTDFYCFIMSFSSETGIFISRTVCTWRWQYNDYMYGPEPLPSFVPRGQLFYSSLPFHHQKSKRTSK